jgi:hypothetical protein
MENTTQFVNDLNVARFLDKLRFEHDPATRASLRRLLLEEEDKLGRSIERLRKVQCHVAEGTRRIALQKALIARLRADGKDVTLTQTTLRNLIDIQQILEQYRQVLRNSIDENRL